MILALYAVVGFCCLIGTLILAARPTPPPVSTRTLRHLRNAEGEGER